MSDVAGSSKKCVLEIVRRDGTHEQPYALQVVADDRRWDLAYLPANFEIRNTLEPPDVIPEVEAVWDLVVRACQSAWPGEKRGYAQSPIELIVDLINERDEALRSAPPPGVIQPNTFALVDYPGHGLHGERVRVVGLYKPTTWSIRANESADGKSFISCAFEESRLRPVPTKGEG